MNHLIIRNAVQHDLDGVMQVEEAAWPEEVRATRGKFAERLQTFAEGFFVAVRSDIVGTTTSQVISYDPYNPPASWTDATADGHISATHNHKGNALYIVSLGVKHPGHGIGSALFDAQKKLAERLGLHYIILCSRVPDYDVFCKEHREMPIEDYIKMERADGFRVDKELRFYGRHGFHPVKICANAMDDQQSRNYGVMVELKLLPLIEITREDDTK